MKYPLLIILMILSLHQVSLAQPPTSISVNGISELRVMPDEAFLKVNLSAKAMTTKEATQTLNEKSKSVEEALKKTGSKAYTFKADNYFVNINRTYTRGSARDSGYVASQALEITVTDTADELVKIVEALHQSTDMGFQLNFRLSREKNKSHQDELLKLALEDARRKAEVIAETMGLGQIRVQKVEYGQEGATRPMLYRAEAMMAMDAEKRTAPTFVPEEQTLSDQVKVVFMAD